MRTKCKIFVFRHLLPICHDHRLQRTQNLRHLSVFFFRANLQFGGKIANSCLSDSSLMVSSGSCEWSCICWSTTGCRSLLLLTGISCGCTTWDSWTAVGFGDAGCSSGGAVPSALVAFGAAFRDIDISRCTRSDWRTKSPGGWAVHLCVRWLTWNETKKA